MVMAIAKIEDDIQSLRVNLVLSKRRERELFNEINLSNVNDRASIIKHFCLIGMYSERLFISEKDAIAPKRKMFPLENSTKESATQKPAVVLKDTAKTNEIVSGKECSRNYSNTDFDEDYELGLEF